MKSKDFNNNVSKKESHEDINKENNIINYFFMFLTILCYIGTFMMIFSHENFWENKKEFIPEGYDLPKLQDFKILLIYFPIILLIKILFETTLQDFMYKYFLANKYKVVEDQDNFKLGLVYKKKLATSLFKVFYYSFSIIVGHFVIRDLGFIPLELGGKGDMSFITNMEYPNYLFFEKSNYFNEYYIIGLAFVLTDLVWLLFLYEVQTDFYLMVLHHSITISLVVFSYLYNFSQIGIIVFYLHDLTDIFVYITRIIINTDYNDVIKITPCVMLLVTYFIYRIYLFGKLIFIIGYYHFIIFKHESNDKEMMILWTFKIFLLIMHIYWINQIIRRFIYYKSSSKIEDVGKIKTQQKTNNN